MHRTKLLLRVLGTTAHTGVCSKHLVLCIVLRVLTAKLLHLGKIAAKTAAIKGPLEQSSLFGRVSSAFVTLTCLSFEVRMTCSL